MEYGNTFYLEGSGNVFYCRYINNKTQTVVSIVQRVSGKFVASYTFNAIISGINAHQVKDAAGTACLCDVIYGKMTSGTYNTYGIMQAFNTGTGAFVNGYYF